MTQKGAVGRAGGLQIPCNYRKNQAAPAASATGLDFTVTPAKAGAQGRMRSAGRPWMPVVAGMTTGRERGRA